MRQNKNKILPFFIFLFFIVLLGFLLYNFVEEDKEPSIKEENYTLNFSERNFSEISVCEESTTENKNETENKISNISNVGLNLTKQHNYTSTYCFSVLSPKKKAWENIWMYEGYIPPVYYYGNNSYFSWVDFDFQDFQVYNHLFDRYYTYNRGCGCSAMIPIEIKNEERLNIYGINIENIPEGHCRCDLAVGLGGMMGFKDAKSNAGNLYYISAGYWMGSRPPQPIPWKKGGSKPTINKNKSKIFNFSFEWEFDEKGKKKILEYFELWGLEGKEEIFKSKDNKSLILCDKFIVDMDKNFATLKAALPEYSIENYTNNTEEMLKFLESVDEGRYKDLTNPQIEWLNESMLFVKDNVSNFILEVEKDKIVLKKFKDVYKFSVRKEDNKTKIYAEEMNIETYVDESINECCEKIDDICFYSEENNGKIKFETEELYWGLNENITYKNITDKEKISFAAGENAKFVPFDIIKTDDEIRVFALLSFCEPALLYENNCGNATKNYTLSIGFSSKSKYKKIDLKILKILPEETYYYYYGNRFYPDSLDNVSPVGVKIEHIGRIDEIEYIISVCP